MLEFLEIERLIESRLRPNAPRHELRIAARRDHDDGCGPTVISKSRRERFAVHPWHPEIEHDAVDRLTVEHGQGVLAILGQEHLMAGA